MNDQLPPTTQDQERRRKAVLATAKWRRENPEKNRALSLGYYNRHKDDPEYRARQRESRRNHRIQIKSRKHVYLGRKYGAEGRYTADEVRRLLAAYDNKCAYCQTPLVRVELDHRIPLSKGGSNWIENILPACRRCNASKCDRTEEEFRATNPAPRKIVRRNDLIPTDHKRCPTCKLVLPLTSFWRMVNGPKGVQSKCKGCATKRQEQYVAANREKRRALANAWYAKNREKVRASQNKAKAEKRLSK